jgi:hypothetical protein
LSWRWSEEEAWIIESHRREDLRWHGRESSGLMKTLQPLACVEQSVRSTESGAANCGFPPRSAPT